MSLTEFKGVCLNEISDLSIGLTARCKCKLFLLQQALVFISEFDSYLKLWHTTIFIQ